MFPLQVNDLPKWLIVFAIRVNELPKKLIVFTKRVKEFPKMESFTVLFIKKILGSIKERCFCNKN